MENSLWHCLSTIVLRMLYVVDKIVKHRRSDSLIKPAKFVNLAIKIAFL